MNNIIMTELGIIVTKDDTCVESFAFNGVSQFMQVKEEGMKELNQWCRTQEDVALVNDLNLYENLKRKDLDVRMMTEVQIDDIQFSKPELLIKAGFANDQNDAMKKLHDFALELSSTKITIASSSVDLHVIQAISSLDELDKITNALSARLKEWYGLHFPELENIVDSIPGYAKVAFAGRKEDLTEQVFKDAGFPESKIQMLEVIKQKSRGGEIDDNSIKIIQNISKHILDLYEQRKILEEHVETQMVKVAPNLTAVLGATVGARILTRAGSLRRLSTMPSSTIQVLGAEKALFRALKTGSQPPKHGILFQHAVVHAAPRWQRGKIARAVAAKAAIASRVDEHGGGLNQTLLDSLNIRVTEITEKYKEPPEPKMRQEFGDRGFRRGEDRGGRRHNDRDGGRHNDRDRGRHNDRDGGQKRRYDTRDNKRTKNVKGKKRKRFDSR